MLHPENLFDYQRQAVRHQLQHPHSMLWLGCGLGKTPVTLTSIVDRMRAGQVRKILIFGPLRVVQAVWERESRKWSHTQHLRFSRLIGPKDKRLRALFTDADIYLCNYENMNWLAGELQHYFLSQNKPLPFQMVVYDEVTQMKSSTALRMAGGLRDRKSADGQHHRVRVHGWRGVLPHIPYRTGLTGTPAANGYMDLHGQYLAVDGGQRLGPHITHFRNSYFESDYMGWNYTPTVMGRAAIDRAIKDITLNMDAADYLDLPRVKVTDVWVDLPARARKVYDDLERQLFAELDCGADIEVMNRAALMNKCLQVSNGNAITGDAGAWSAVHDAKLDALASVLEEAGGAPVLCSYSYRSDAARIMERFKKYRPVNLTEEPSRKTGEIIDKWNAGGIRLLIGHPKSMGHGIDGLQDSGNIVVWFGPNWSLELTDQMNHRINRQGQTKPVSIIRLLGRDTVDMAVVDALAHKDDTQEGLKAAIRRYRSSENLAGLSFI